MTAQAASPSRAEQVQQAKRERRCATFTQVHELSAQGLSFASIARMLGMNKKTVCKLAESEQFPISRKLARLGCFPGRSVL